MMKEEYYRLISQYVSSETTVFRSEVDQYILTRHAEGAKHSAIVSELEARGISKHRHSIRFIIRRYEMAWGIKKYSDKQLNKKVKDGQLQDC
jgi:hypothetical protein